MAIQFVGQKNLTEREDVDLRRICKRCLPKIERASKKAKVTFVIKKQEKEGAKPRFILAATINDPPLIIKAKSEDWTITTAAHQIFDKLETELTKKEIKKRQKTVTV